MQSWSPNQCLASTKLLARVSLPTITFSLLLEPLAVSSTALEGFSMESSWTGFILKHLQFPMEYFYLLNSLTIFNFQDKLPNSNGRGDGPLDNPCFHSVYHICPWQGKFFTQLLTLHIWMKICASGWLHHLDLGDLCNFSWNLLNPACSHNTDLWAQVSHWWQNLSFRIYFKAP